MKKLPRSNVLAVLIANLFVYFQCRVNRRDYNTYGARRGNDEIMSRGKYRRVCALLCRRDGFCFVGGVRNDAFD